MCIIRIYTSICCTKRVLKGYILKIRKLIKKSDQIKGLKIRLTKIENGWSM